MLTLKLVMLPSCRTINATLQFVTCRAATFEVWLVILSSLNVGDSNCVFSCCVLMTGFLVLIQLVETEDVKGVLTLNEEYETRFLCNTQQVGKMMPLGYM